MNEPRSDRTFYGIQALRAIAASMVVLVHCIYLWHARILHESHPQYWMNGGAGVDVFFAISGFVMTISLPTISQFKNRAGVFLWRRITRIVPLYWLATTLKVVVVLAVPAAVLHPGIRWSNVLGSYLFIPTANPDGQILPVIVPGWTLNYEMFFYLLFSGSLLVRFSPMRLIIPALGILAVFSLSCPIDGPPFLTLISPLLFEFLFGILIARAVMTKRMPGTWSSVTLAIVGWVAILTLFPHLSQESAGVQKWRFAFWGLPAAAIVLGTVGIERILAAKLPKWVFEAGNASYAVYLGQTFVLPVVGIIVNRLPIGQAPALALIVVMGMSLTLLVGDLIHRWIELPTLRWLKRVTVPGVNTLPGVGVGQ
jgi:exopolysaccharide production protein ExoZ